MAIEKQAERLAMASQDLGKVIEQLEHVRDDVLGESKWDNSIGDLITDAVQLRENLRAERLAVERSET